MSNGELTPKEEAEGIMESFKDFPIRTSLKKLMAILVVEEQMREDNEIEYWNAVIKEIEKL